MKHGILISEHEKAGARRRRNPVAVSAVDGTGLATALGLGPGLGLGQPKWTARRRRIVANFTGWSFVAPATMIILGLSMFPAAWAFLISREHWNGLTPARQIGWDNYRLMLRRTPTSSPR